MSGINKWTFPKTEILSRKNKVEIDLSTYGTEADFKNATVIDVSKFAKKVDLASLKSEADKSGIDNLEKVPTGLTQFEK